MCGKLEFDHFSTQYVFRGANIKLPDPGTYDASKWTPPTRELWTVVVWDSGSWQLKRGYDGGAVVREDAEGGKRSRSWAKSVIEKYVEEMAVNVG